MDRMAKITINGKAASFEEGTTILNAARQMEIHIPTFCYFPGLKPMGACRICMVEIEGQQRLQPACITAIADGMAVQTNSDAVRRANKGNLELILTNHPLDCPVCDKGGECELQDMVMDLGPRQGKFDEQKRVFHVQDLPLNDVIIFNANRCIQCQRCVQTCNDVVGAFALGAIERGHMTEISGFGDDLKNCDQCGNCIEVCPVGALMNRPYRYRARPWDLVRTETLCPYCGTGCQFTVETRDNELVRIRSPQASGLNAETLCAKGRFGIDFINHPDRITQPMIRRDGQLVAVSWDEAAAYLREHLLPLPDGQRIGGLISPRLSNESLYGFQKLMRSLFRSNNIDAFDRWNYPITQNQALSPVAPLAHLIRTHYSRRPLTDLIAADLTFICGCDVSDENPVSDYLIRRTRANQSSKLFVASSRPSRLAQDADAQINWYPGAELLLVAQVLNALRQRMAESGSAPLPDMDNLNHLPCPDFHAEEFIAELSANLDSSHSISILIGLEILYSNAAKAILQMLDDLISVLKVLGKKVQMQWLFDRPNQLGAWDLGLLPGHLPGMIPHSDPVAQKKLSEAWFLAPPQSQGADFNEMVTMCSAGEMDTLYIVGADPLLSYPDREKLEHAFSELRLLVVQDGFFSSTAQYADILLPADIYGECGGSFTNNEGRVQLARAFQMLPKGVKTDTELFGWMAENLGVDLGSMEQEALFSEICCQVPGYQLLGNGVFDSACKFTEEIPDQLEIKLFCPEISPRDTPEGFMLITGNCRSHSGHLSEKSNTLNKIQGQAYLTLNMQDAEVWEIHTDDLVIVKANGHEITVPARLDKQYPRGLLFIPNNFADVPLNRLFNQGQYPCPAEIEKARCFNEEARWN